MEIILIVIIAILLILLGILVYLTNKLSKIVFIYEDDIAELSNIIIDVNERLNEVQRIRSLMSHPYAASYIAEGLEELRYCDYLLTNMIVKARMLLKKDYTELKIERNQPGLLTRLENKGYYDPEEDGGINIMDPKEAADQAEYAKRIKKDIDNKSFYKE